MRHLIPDQSNGLCSALWKTVTLPLKGPGRNHLLAPRSAEDAGTQWCSHRLSSTLEQAYHSWPALNPASQLEWRYPEGMSACAYEMHATLLTASLLIVANLQSLWRAEAKGSGRDGNIENIRRYLKALLQAGTWHIWKRGWSEEQFVLASAKINCSGADVEI